MNIALRPYKILLLLTAFFLISSIAYSAPPIDPRILPSNESPDPLEVKWKERGGEIVIESICFNYPADSSETIRCKQLAAERFKRECEDFKLLYHNSRPRYVDDYKEGMDKFCGVVDALSD